MQEATRRRAWGDFGFLIPAAFVAIVILVENWHGKAMGGVLRAYEDFGKIICSGFDPMAGDLKTPTFPMWGYGWLMLALPSKLALLVFQGLLGLVALGVLAWHVRDANVLPEKAITVLKLCLLGAIPWYAEHAVRWPLSISASLLIISFIFLQRGILGDPPSARATAFSGALLGLSLNFRSDAILMPIGLAVAVFLLARKGARTKAAKLAALWIGTIYVMLVPWMAYSYHAIGHVLVTSTNGGANFYCGLGNMPENKWGITMNDGDPSMHRLLKEKLTGPPDTAPWTPLAYLKYEGDQILKHEAARLVREDPGEYVRKCLYTVGLIATSGCYSGEFFELTEESLPPDAPRPVISRWTLRYWLMYVSARMDVKVIFYSLLLLPLTLVFALRERNAFFLLVWLAVAYQTTLNSASGFLPGYSSLAFLFHFLNVFYAGVCLTFLGLRLREKLRARERAAESPETSPSPLPERA